MCSGPGGTICASSVLRTRIQAHECKELIISKSIKILRQIIGGKLRREKETD